MASSLQSETLKQLRHKPGVLAYSNNASAISLTGLPDIVVHIKGGRSIWAEVKEPGDRVLKGGVQEKRMEQLQQLGFYVTIIRSREDVKNFIKYIEGII